MTDRLERLRAQRQAEPAPVPAPAPAHAPPQQNGTYELNAVGRGNGAPDDFYGEISSIQESITQFNANVRRISDLHSSSLSAVGDGAGQQNLALLDDQVTQTRDLGNQIKKRIETLKKQPIPRGQEARRNQTTVVAKQFVTALQNYTKVEQEYRKKQRERVQRQLKIVKPDATQDEVNAVLDGEGGDQIFANAVSSSTRYGESRAAYREVQDRHNDIKKIERTLGEVAQLMNDMSVLVEQQGEAVEDIEQKAQEVEHNTAQGLTQTEKAVKYARSARGKRVICFWLTILLLLIIAAAVAGSICGQGKCK